MRHGPICVGVASLGAWHMRIHDLEFSHRQTVRAAKCGIAPELKLNDWGVEVRVLAL